MTADRPLWRRTLDLVIDIFEEEDDPNEPGYDPAHVGAMIVIVLVSITVLFWDLWSLLVCEGGIFPKIWPAILVAIGRRTIADFGYKHWYDQGVFEGWVVNLGALLFLAFIVGCVISVFRGKRRSA